MCEKQNTPYFEVKSPEGETFRVEIASRFTIGRSESNDLRLSDPQQLISRSHCLVEKRPGGWQVTDNGTVNGTFVRRDNGSLEAVRGVRPLVSGETVCILGIFVEQESPRYWELTFFDPAETNKAQLPLELFLAYDWLAAKLYRIFGEKKEEISLRPNEHKFIRYMVSRNRSNGGNPVLCTYEDLAEAVWGEEVGKDLVNHLTSSLRRKIEMNPQEPKWLEVQRGLGFRLLIPTL